MRFLIMDRPTEVNLPTYLRELKKAGVTDIVRVCEPSYSADEVRFEERGAQGGNAVREGGQGLDAGRRKQMGGRASERANERTSERANERTNERANERMSERASESVSTRRIEL